MNVSHSLSLPLPISPVPKLAPPHLSIAPTGLHFTIGAFCSQFPAESDFKFLNIKLLVATDKLCSEIDVCTIHGAHTHLYSQD